MTMAAALEERTVTPSTPRHHPQPAAPLRHDVQGQPRAPDAVPHGRRHPRRVEQHRHHARRARRWRRRRCTTTSASSASARSPGSGSRVSPRASSRSPRTGAGRSAHRRVRAGLLRHRDPGRLGVPDHRQRRRARRAAPRRERHRRRRQGDADAEQQQGVRVVSKDTATNVSRMLEGVVGPDGTGRGGPDHGLPSRRQDRHRGLLRRRCRWLQRLHRELHRVRARRRPADRRRRHRCRSRTRAFFGGYVGARCSRTSRPTPCRSCRSRPPTGRPGDPAQLGGRGLGPQRPGGPQR